MTRLRWYLAHLLAPRPIIADPFPGAEAFVIHRKGGTSLAFELITFDVLITNAPIANLFGAEGQVAFNGGGRTLTFTGTGHR